MKKSSQIWADILIVAIISTVIIFTSPSLVQNIRIGLGFQRWIRK